MIPLGLLLTFTGYGVGSWGWVLVKGWNIPLRQWFSPLNPWQWPAGGTVPAVPKGHIFPTAEPAAGEGNAGPAAGAGGGGQGVTLA